MKQDRLKRLIFMALCCDLGIFGKRIISPAANLVTEALRIPGGISAGFSLMFLVIAAVFIPWFGCGALMGVVQSAVAFVMGTIGSMGALSPISYILPGLMIDIVLLLGRKAGWKRLSQVIVANGAASLMACLVANTFIFHLRGPILLLYMGAALGSGILFGWVGAQIAGKLSPLFASDGKIAKKSKRYKLRYIK